MFVSTNENTLPLTASSTPTTYAIPSSSRGSTRVRVFNDAGATILFKQETSSSATLVAPVAGTAAHGTAMANQAVEMFDLNPTREYITLYSATGTGTVYFQFTTGE